MYSGQLIIDADFATDRWEIALRWDSESLEVAWSGVRDADLPEIVGHSAAFSLIANREEQERCEEMMILSGCAKCGARLVNGGKPIRGAKVVYPPGTDSKTAVGTPLCAKCFREVVK